jgi:hypothetical protein
METVGFFSLYPIEEGRAARKGPHSKFGYFLSMPQQGVSADITKNSALAILDSQILK